ncbi:hypothetical protein DOM22_01145 [Bdellovibrio sp. ZAP7]|nr:hypothetical protein DOM22_01145 [Bdellovibrio sp. ZAP7]
MQSQQRLFHILLNSKRNLPDPVPQKASIKPKARCKPTPERSKGRGRGYARGKTSQWLVLLRSKCAPATAKAVPASTLFQLPQWQLKNVPTMPATAAHQNKERRHSQSLLTAFAKQGRSRSKKQRAKMENRKWRTTFASQKW